MDIRSLDVRKIPTWLIVPVVQRLQQPNLSDTLNLSLRVTTKPSSNMPITPTQHKLIIPSLPPPPLVPSKQRPVTTLQHMQQIQIMDTKKRVHAGHMGNDQQETQIVIIAHDTTKLLSRACSQHNKSLTADRSTTHRESRKSGRKP